MAELAGLKIEYDPEAELLSRHSDAAGRDLSSNHSTRTAPVFTSEALDILGPTSHSVATQFERPSKLYVNTNAPFSAVVCGLQGSGKSHSTSVLLEGCLIQDHRLGTLPAPLCGLLFHFDSAAGSGYVQPCEAAYLASLDAVRGGNAAAPDVTVLVMPNRVEAMRAVYANLPGVKVEALRFASGDISGERLLAMMKVDESNLLQMPLYMELILTLLRDMEVFDYNEFRAMLAKQMLNGSQKSMLNLRLALLDSCLKGGDESNCVTKFFKQGALTIVDLSSPFIDSSSACGFFDIILSLFVEVEVSTGKIIVLDEAHKYLSDTNHSSKLTDSLLSIIRQQRHLNARVVISTQEPTVVPSKFLELSSFIIAHRFSSPKWLQHLAEHVSAAQTVKEEIFEKIIDLRTGEGILFAPSGLGIKSAEKDPSGSSTVAPFGQGYLVIHSRQRITRDGGHSFLAVRDEAANTRIGRVAAPKPMKSATTAGYTFARPSTAPEEAPPFTGQSVRDTYDATGRSIPVPAPSVLYPPLPPVYSTSTQVSSTNIRSTLPAVLSARAQGLTPATITQLSSVVKAKNRPKYLQPQSYFNHDTHLPMILRVLREQRDRGIALVPFSDFKKALKARYPVVKGANVLLKVFLVEETRTGAIVFGYQGSWKKHAVYYVKLVEE